MAIGNIDGMGCCLGGHDVRNGKHCFLKVDIYLPPPSKIK